MRLFPGFRDETKSSKHLFRPSEQTRRTSWQVTQVKSAVVSTCLELEPKPQTFSKYLVSHLYPHPLAKTRPTGAWRGTVERTRDFISVGVRNKKLGRIVLIQPQTRKKNSPSRRKLQMSGSDNNNSVAYMKYIDECRSTLFSALEEENVSLDECTEYPATASRKSLIPLSRQYRKYQISKDDRLVLDHHTSNPLEVRDGHFTLSRESKILY